MIIKRMLLHPQADPESLSVLPHHKHDLYFELQRPSGAC
jgi:hypothetical protein